MDFEDGAFDHVVLHPGIIAQALGDFHFGALEPRADGRLASV